MTNNYNQEPKIAKIIDEYKVVLNKGSNDNVEEGQKFLIYQQTEEIKDPDTQEVLECLFVAKGVGIIVQVQKKISILKSDEYVKPTSLAEAFSVLSMPNKLQPFDNPKIGDCARLLSGEDDNFIPTCTKCGQELSTDDLKNNNNMCSECVSKIQE